MASETDWFSEETATFGDRLAGAREALGMSQEDLSRRLGVKLKTTRAWENDMSEPRSNKLLSLSGVLNVSIRWLLTGEGDGVAAFEEEEALSPDANDLLIEMRALRNRIDEDAKRLGVLEKRLRPLLKATT